MADPVIRIENLSKIYRLYDKPFDRLLESLNPFQRKLHRDFFALKNISFEIRRGEKVGIVGKNGSGKSTLLKIITGVLAPTKGCLQVDGKISAILELEAGYNPEYTGLENIYLNGAVLGYGKSAIESKLDSILSFADIGDFIHQPVKTYSSGMLVRLAFAVAINVDPDILIVDEALSVGDALFQRKCFAKINSFIEGGKTVLFVSHDLEILTQLCDRAFILDNGELILSAQPNIVRNYYIKLLFSTGDQYMEAREEIRKINEAEENPPMAEDSPLMKEEADASRVSEAGPTPEDLQKGLFLPDMISKSIACSKKYDVDIDEIAIKNVDGETVNYIATHGTYTFSFRAKFNITVDRVSFGMVFRTLTGLTVTIAHSPGKYPLEYIDHVEAGEEYRVEWQFKCALMTGTYTTCAVVWGVVENEEWDYLNKVLDATIFKVQDHPDSKYGGIVHLEQRDIIKQPLSQRRQTP